MNDEDDNTCGRTIIIIMIKYEEKNNNNISIAHTCVLRMQVPFCVTIPYSYACTLNAAMTAIYDDDVDDTTTT